MKICRTLFNIIRDEESGQDLIEYALVAGLIALASIATLSRLASNIGVAFNNAGTTITSAT